MSNESVAAYHGTIKIYDGTSALCSMPPSNASTSGIYDMMRVPSITGSRRVI